VVFMILSFLCTCDLVQGLGDGRGKSYDADPLVAASGWEVRHASNGAVRAHDERERDRRAASRAVRKWGMEVPTRSPSSREGEMTGGGGDSASSSPPRVVSSQHQGVASLLTGPSIDE
jgi:hypothetical protein